MPLAKRNPETGEWEQFTERNALVERPETKVTLILEDDKRTRIETEVGKPLKDIAKDLKPYTKKVRVSASVAEQDWDDETLARHGLARYKPFVVPEGMMTVGEHRLGSGAVPVEEYDVEPLPPPPPPLTPTQKLDRFLEATGLTREELIAELGKK